MAEVAAPPLAQRPVTRATTADEASRTVEFTLSTGAAVHRFGERPDGTRGHWSEILDVAGADLSRMKGAPLLRDLAASIGGSLSIGYSVSEWTSEEA